MMRKTLLIVIFSAPIDFKIPIMFVLSKIKTSRTLIIFIEQTNTIMNKIANMFLSNICIQSNIEEYFCLIFIEL